MKISTKLILIAAVLSGTVSLNIHKVNDKTVIEIQTENPEQIMETAGKIVSAAGSTISQISAANAESGQAAEAAAPVSGEVFYRIRNTNYDAASQLNAYKDLDTAIAVCPAGYCVFDCEGNMLYRAEG